MATRTTERMKYRIVLKDSDGFEIGDREAETLKEAKAQAKHMLSDGYANLCEVTHSPGDRERVEVLNLKDEIIFDDERTW